MKPILYQFQISPFCDKVRRAMRLKGLTWDSVEVPIVPPGKYKHISPTGKFPAVDFGGTIIVDSTDIIVHLDAMIAEPRLIPTNPRDRADALILEDWADESLYFFDLTMRNWPANRQLFVDDLLHAESGLKRRIIGKLIPGALKKVAISQGLGRKTQQQVTAELARHYDNLDARLDDREWLVGNSISIADLAVRSMVFVLDRTIEGKALSTARPALASWSLRVDAASL
jgi:glutathione S-transferase